MSGQSEGTDVTDSNEAQASQNAAGNGNRKCKVMRTHPRVKRSSCGRKRNREGQPISEGGNENCQVVIENVGTSDVPSQNIEIIDVEQVKDKPVVDLTNESRNDVYVDLTNTPEVVPPRRQSVIFWQGGLRRNWHHTSETNSKKKDDIVIVPSGSERVENITSEPSQMSDDVMTCAICMDDFNQIKKAKRQLTSTTCGHVFCNPCIASSLRAQAKCPTCRKKLTKKQLHPIFL